MRFRFPERFPQHVTLRVVDGVSIRKGWLRPIIFGAIADSQREDYRINEFDVLGNHMHFVIEAASAEALASGMIGLQVRLVRRLNRALGRSGELFPSRYHTRALKTPTEVRNALRYVLLNARHHAAERGDRLNPLWVDPFSSGPWFDGWDRPVRDSDALSLARELRPPTQLARTWLLRIGWRKLGALSWSEAPGVTSPATAPAA